MERSDANGRHPRLCQPGTITSTNNGIQYKEVFLMCFYAITADLLPVYSLVLLYEQRSLSSTQNGDSLTNPPLIPPVSVGTLDPPAEHVAL